MRVVVRVEVRVIVLVLLLLLSSLIEVLSIRFVALVGIDSSSTVGTGTSDKYK